VIGARRSGRCHGLSLAEVLLAAAILGTTAMLVYPMFVSSGRIQASGRYRALAAGFARETMETLRARRLSELPAGEGTDPILPADHPFNARLRGLRRYSVRDVVGPGFGGAAPAGAPRPGALPRGKAEACSRRA
jgi:hypothetical protein